SLIYLQLDGRESDTGERLVAKSVLEVGGASPSSNVERDLPLVLNKGPVVNGDLTGRLKQALFGDRFGAHFGRDTTIGNGASFEGPHVKSFADPASVQQHLRDLEARGWGLPTVLVHTGNWSPIHLGGWHAVSMKSEGDNIRIVNNWAGNG